MCNEGRLLGPGDTGRESEMTANLGSQSEGTSVPGGTCEDVIKTFFFFFFGERRHVLCGRRVLWAKIKLSKRLEDLSDNCMNVHVLCAVL